MACASPRDLRPGPPQVDALRPVYLATGRVFPPPSDATFLYTGQDAAAAEELMQLMFPTPRPQLQQLGAMLQLAQTGNASYRVSSAQMGFVRDGADSWYGRGCGCGCVAVKWHGSGWGWTSRQHQQHRQRCCTLFEAQVRRRQPHRPRVCLW